MNAEVAASERSRKITIGFNNFAHAVDHYVMLIFPTVVIGLEVVYGRPYAELLVLGTEFGDNFVITDRGVTAATPIVNPQLGGLSYGFGARFALDF